MERPQSPDHVCLGSRGLGSLQTALLNAVGLGSVGEHVVKNVRVPVTVVPLSTPVPENITVRTGVSSTDCDASERSAARLFFFFFSLVTG